MISPLEIQARVDAHTLATEDQALRPYLGASEIGEKCLRKLWYSFRWCGKPQFDGRMLRLFARGDREEPVFHELLKGAGFIVRTPDKEGEEPFKFKDCEGHFAGTCDAAIGEGDHAKWLDFQIDEDDVEWSLAEFKTWKVLGGGNFNDLKRLGIKECEPKYYAQMQTYMGELGFPQALFCAVCKENDELYFEWVTFDQQHFNVQLSKAETVINATIPPERISNDPKTFSCRYCQFNRICHENIPIPKLSHHCRNCRHASPAAAGSWNCAKGQAFGTLCPHYQSICGGSAAD